MDKIVGKVYDYENQHIIHMYKRLQCKLTILIHSGGRIDF